MEMRKRDRKRKRISLKKASLVFSVKPGKALSATYYKIWRFSRFGLFNSSILTVSF